MGKRTIGSKSNEEEIIATMKGMLSEVKEKDSLMLIRIRQVGDRVEASAINSVRPDHLIYLNETFDDSFEEQLKTLADRDPIIAAMVVMELLDVDTKKD